MLDYWAGGRILLHPHYAARRDDLFIARMKSVWMMTEFDTGLERWNLLRTTWRMRGG